MTPPRARTWSRRGHTPVIRVRGRSRRRTSVAALCCYKAGEKSRLIHRPRTHLLLKGARESFSWQDYRDLLVRAHIQLDGPIVVVWDNLNTHLAAGLKRYEAEHDWLTTVRLPPYAPDLNPVEAVWSLVRRAMANTAFTHPTTSTASSAASHAGSNSDPVSTTAASAPQDWPSTHRPRLENLQ
ncbi:transposase [Streptomyces sp. NPDC086010]|uniref:transposase n=1 Tax=Streptomyces sp. NPDC086010 TaxID=3365745 RepID=UPI0037D48CCB